MPRKPQDQRDRQQLKDSTNHHVNDSANRAQSGMPDTRGMGWKDIGGVILLLVILLIAYSLYQVFFG
ncbi:DUF6366 family protein [Planococcus sp. SIMBA_160]